MVVVAVKLALNLLDSPQSLKEKRTILKRLKERLKNRFNSSVAEVELQDIWNYASIGVSYVALDNLTAENFVGKLIDYIESDTSIEVYDKYVDFIVI